MKKLALSLLVIPTFFFGFGQNIFLVDNTPSKPTGSHVYSNLQTAINATSPGDIIHVKPSGQSYGDITITVANDSISIYGIGLNPDKEILLTSTIGTIYISGKNVKIAGIKVNGPVYLGYSAVAGNLSFENDHFVSTVSVGYGYNTSNVLFRNCIFFQPFQTYDVRSNNTVVSNSIFSYSTNTATGQVHAYNGTLLSHCLFYGDGGTRTSFAYLNNSTVSNCIFYGRSPQVSNSYTNSTFNNCYVEQSHQDVFPVGNGNSVNGTIGPITGSVFTDTNILLGLTWNINWDVTLDPASTELVNGGDDNTDVGLTGGTIAFSNKATPLPYIRSFVVPTVIKQGDDLDVSINAVGN